MEWDGEAALGPGPGRRFASAPATILLAGLVDQVEQLKPIGRLERARLRDLVSGAARAAPDAIVVGGVTPVRTAVERIAALKDDSRTASLPVLHVTSPRAPCSACRAELCIAGDGGTYSLASAVRLLLRLRHAELDPESEAAAAAARLASLERLAGEMVHDFTRLLDVATGHVDLRRRVLADGGAGGEPPRRTVAPARTAGRRQTVLLADGTDAVREVTASLLEELGYHVISAATADEALGRLRERSTRIDLVLADAAMPGLDGSAFADVLTAARPRARVLLVSGEPGAFPRPFTRAGLARALRAALSREV